MAWASRPAIRCHRCPVELALHVNRIVPMLGVNGTDGIGDLDTSLLGVDRADLVFGIVSVG